MAKNGFVLRIAPSMVDRVAEALENNQLIIGWAAAKGLLDPGLEWDGFREIIRNEYYTDAENLRKTGNASGHMWRFIRDMEAGDMVVVPSGSEFYVGVVRGPAIYDECKVDDDSAYRRPVEWLNGKQSIPRAIAKSALVSRMKAQGTCTNATDLVEEIEECLAIAGRGEEPSFEKDLQGRLVKETLDELRSGRMESFGFERLIATVLRGLGAVETKIVSRREDKGIDIYATFLVAGAFRQVVGVQAKHFQPEPPVGADVVQQLVRGIEEGPERVTLGMVITSGTFSDDAVAEAEAYGEKKRGIPIELLDGEQFAKLIVEHGLSETG
jgi:predicted Mrr-cat superfamily restriction endonuclease